MVIHNDCLGGSTALTSTAQNYIKHNAREHDTFRKICVNFAQNLHRIDMRLRLGLLQDPAVIERQIARELAEAEAQRVALRPKVPTVKTEAQSKADEELAKKKRKQIEQHAKAPPRIRPLSESKAIETGANFISESFLFMVAGGVIIFENWRSRRKESNRRDEVKERLVMLEQEKEDMKLWVTHLSELTQKLAELEAADTREGSGHRSGKTAASLTTPPESLRINGTPHEKVIPQTETFPVPTNSIANQPLPPPEAPSETPTSRIASQVSTWWSPDSASK